jgi:hypothetical protein
LRLLDRAIYPQQALKLRIEQKRLLQIRERKPTAAVSKDFFPGLATIVLSEKFSFHCAVERSQSGMP